MATFSASDVLNEIAQQAPQFGVDPRMASALFMAENSGSGAAKTGSGDAVSSANARGVMQVTDSTARGLQKAGFLPNTWKFNPDDLASQVQAGLAAIKEKTKRLNDPSDIFELGASYNAGTAAHKNYQAGNLSALPAETKDYFRKLTVAANNQGMKVSNPMDATTVGATTPAAGEGDWGPDAPPTGTTPPTPGTTVSSRSTVRRNVFDSGALSDFTASINQAGQTYDAAANTIIQGGKLRDLAVQGMQKAVTDHAVAEGQEAGLTAAIDAADRARRVAILASQNLNPDFTDNLLVKTGKVVDDTDAQLRALKPEIDERMSVGMFDNPFQWLVNQTILPGLVSRYNGIASTQNAAIELYKNKEAMVKSQIDISSQMDADMILRKGVQTQAKIAAAATEKLSKVQYEASAATARDSMNLAAIASDKVNITGAAAKMTKETESDTVADNEKHTTEQSRAEALAAVNDIQNQIGGAQYKNWIQFQSEPPAKREQLLAAARSKKYGDGFGESFKLIDTHGNWMNMAMTGDSAVQGWTRKTVTEANALKDANLAAMEKTNPSEYAKITSSKKLKEEYMQSQLDAVQQKYQVQAATDMRNASDGNPYKLSYTNIAKDPSLATTNPVALWLNKYGPAGTDPRFSKVDESFLMDRWAAGIAEGRIPMADGVKAITEFYKVGTLQQIKSTKPSLFGMELPEKTYAINLPALHSKKPIDMGNPVDVEYALTRLVAARATTLTAPILNQSIAGE